MQKEHSENGGFSATIAPERLRYEEVTMPRIVHRCSGAPTEGRRVRCGETLSKDDVYESGDGTWRPCPEELVGTLLRDEDLVWVRLEQ